MRKMYVILMVWLMAATTTVAESSVETVATGFGATYQDALSVALRNAAESASGLIVASGSTMERGELVEDRTATAAAAHVRAYEVLDRDVTEEGTAVTIKAQVARWPIGKPIEAPIQQSPPSNLDALQGALKNLRLQRDVLQTYLGDAEKQLEMGYDAYMAGYVIEDVSLDGVHGYYRVMLSANKGYWDNYFWLIERMDVGREHGNAIDEGRITVNSAAAAVHPNARHVHASLEPYLARPLHVHVSVGQSALPVTLYKNSAFTMSRPNELLRIERGRDDETGRVHDGVLEFNRGMLFTRRLKLEELNEAGYSVKAYAGMSVPGRNLAERAFKPFFNEPDHVFGADCYDKPVELRVPFVLGSAEDIQRGMGGLNISLSPLFLKAVSN